MSTFTPSARLAELRDNVVYLEAELAAIHTAAEGRSLDTDEQTRWDDGQYARACYIAEGIDLEARERAAAAFDAGSFEQADVRTSFQFKADADPFDRLDEVRYMPEDARRNEFRGRALKVIESTRYTDDAHGESAARLVEVGDADGERARYIVEHDGPEYLEGFYRYMRQPQAGIGHAVRGLSERAAMSLTAANGGVAVPQFLDPSVILTNSGAVDPFRGISTVKTITVKTWEGVTSAGVTAEWIGEATEVADASPTFAGPTIDAHKADAYIQGSIEIIADSALSGELAGLISDAKFRLEATAHAVGSGSNQPFGIVTALGLTTTSRVAGSSGAAGAADLVAADIYALDNDLGDRWRDAPAKFVGSKKIWNTVRQLGTSNTYHAFWTDFGGGLPPQLIGYDVHRSSAMDTTIVSGSNDDVIVLGDFGQFYLVDRMGMELVYNPLVLGSNRRPTGEVGWVAFWRHGSDSVVDDAFRMLRL